MKLLVLGGINHHLSGGDLKRIQDLKPSEIYVLMVAGVAVDVRKWAQENDVLLETVPILWHKHREVAILTAVSEAVLKVDAVVLFHGGHYYDVPEKLGLPVYDWR